MRKRTFDILFSLSLLLILSPLLLIIAATIKLTDGGTVFYKGVRAGKGMKPFKMYKFRSMVKNADKIGGPTTSDDDPRLTRIGLFLRKYKLDELPQFINVLRGEMSIVGPRPEVLQEIEEFKKEYEQILQVLPGITDYASLKFPNEGEIVKGTTDPHQTYKNLIQPEKILLQMYYAKNHTFWEDIKIIGRTIKKVFIR